MKLIDRWSLMRCTQRENVQEHSLQVAMVAHALALIKNKYFEGEIAPEEVVLYAIFHDSTEVLTGDLPTPVKYYNSGLEELAAGNHEFSRAKKTIEDKVKTLCAQPEDDYFVKHFVPSFSLTLDEISQPLET